jgi:hypothetical protein
MHVYCYCCEAGNASSLAIDIRHLHIAFLGPLPYPQSCPTASPVHVLAILDDAQPKPTIPPLVQRARVLSYLAHGKAHGPTLPNGHGTPNSHVHELERSGTLISRLLKRVRECCGKNKQGHGSGMAQIPTKKIVAVCVGFDCRMLWIQSSLLIMINHTVGYCN